jgi:E3 ubiquitin-protein ligase RNF14
MTPEERLQILSRRAAGNKDAAAEILNLKLELMSVAAIRTSSKQCPCCGMAIQKSEGCNKMYCTSCSSYFCYKCGKQISGYSHFREDGCLLFDLDEVLRWEMQFNAEIHGARAALWQDDARFAREVAAAQNDVRHEMEARGCRCPRCGQMNYKERQNNHMQCFACQNHYCYMCRQALVGRGASAKHYGPKAACKQHSPD